MTDPGDKKRTKAKTEAADETLGIIHDIMMSAPVVSLAEVRAAGETGPAGDLAPRQTPDPPPQDHPRSSQDDGANDDDGGEDGPRWARNEYGLPELCPITPLGKRGMHYFYLDALRQFISLSAKDHSRNNLAGMFAPHTELATKLYPRKKLVKTKDDDGGVTETWKVIGFRPEKITDDLMDACARKGVWDPVNKLRGPGAWLGDDGELILHCGTKLWMQDGEHPPGELSGIVYPAAKPMPLPWPEPVAPASEGGPGKEILDLLKTFNWKRKSLDPILMLGWIMAAKLSGALEWRPSAWVTGDLATGKSTVHKIIGYLLDDAIVQTSDTTAAGIYQHVGMSSLPVAIDEIEADARSEKNRAVLRLMRLAGSGSVMLRGSAEHAGVEFKARSCFLFSSILIPALEPQDRSRLAILDLKPLEIGAKPPKIEPRHFRELGQKLTRRMVDQWHLFPEILHEYQAALVAVGHSNRGALQFGTLLACADLVLFDGRPEADHLAYMSKLLAADVLKETALLVSNAKACLNYLSQSHVDIYRSGQKKTIAELVTTICGEPGGRAADPGDISSAKHQLATIGIAVVNPRKFGCHPFLAVPDTHRQVQELFDGTPWHGKAGVGGVWSQALARLDGAVENSTQKIAGRCERCTLVPVSLIIAGEPSDEEQAGTTADETEDETEGVT